MPRNVEIKVRLADLEAARARVIALGARYLATEQHVDRYYQIDPGHRVKLRMIDGQSSHLIRYHRPETSGVRTSEYTLTPVRDPEQQACPVPKGKPLVIVSKQREILLLDNVRIHLDRVETLGTFLELEAVVDAAHDDAVCRRQVVALIGALGVSDRDLIRSSYADLVREAYP